MAFPIHNELDEKAEQVKAFLEYHFRGESWSLTYPRHLPYYEEVTSTLSEKGLLPEI